MSNGHASNDVGVLDPQVLQDLRELGGEDDPGLLNELIGMFLDDAPRRLGDITGGLASGDVKTLERAAHTLKSSSANIGAVSLSALCRQIEEIARQNRTDGLAPLVESASRDFEKVAAELKRLLA